MEKRVALVTGGNKGIGLEVARQLGAAGLAVVLGVRNTGRGEAAAAELRVHGVEVRVVELDLTRPETFRAAADEIAREFGRLDVLVNNAGIVAQGDGPPSTANLYAVETIWKTNFLGTLGVTQAMLPLVRKSAAGRIVNVSSGLGSLTQHGDPSWPYAAVKVIGYCSSKTALNMLTVQLAWELRDTSIKVNSSDPGYTATDLNGNSGPQTVAEGAAETVRLALLGEDGPAGGYFATEGQVPW